MTAASNGRLRRCELVHRATNDEPTCVAFHPSGFELLVGYKERVRLYSVLLSELKASFDMTFFEDAA